MGSRFLKSFEQTKIQLKTVLDPQTFVASPRFNTIVNIVPQGREYIVERYGKYEKTLRAGVNYVNPFTDRIRYGYSVKEQSYMIPSQSATTLDNVIVEIDGIVFLRVVDSYKASYNVDNPIYNLINLAQTVLRSEISRLSLESLFRERTTLNSNVQSILQKEAEGWGIECKRHELKEITVSEAVRISMDLQAEAERHKRKQILDSEGEALAQEIRARGVAKAQKYEAEANQYAVKCRAEAEADALRIRSSVEVEHISHLANTLEQAGNASEKAAALYVAEEYLSQFGKLANSANTVLADIPVGDPGAMASRALSLYKRAQEKKL